MSQFQDTTIREVIDNINKKYFLPDIQREFVWSEEQIINLFDSILRGYPIGSFLFWQINKFDIKKDEINFQLYKFIEKYDVRKPHNEKEDIEQITAEDLWIVLDGQQRLTALYSGLRGSRTTKKYRAKWNSTNAFEKKKLYLDLCYTPDPEDPEDKHAFKFFSDEQIAEERKNSTDDSHWYEVNNIFRPETAGHRYMRDYKLSPEASDLLEKLNNSIHVQPRIAYFKETEKSLNRVLDIFIKVNSGGTKLSYSDLLMSLLTANFGKDIRETMYACIDNIKDREFGIFNRDTMLKSCLLLTESPHKFILSNFSRANISKIEHNWDDIVNAIDQSMHILDKLGYKGVLSSGYILSTIALYYYQKKFKQGNDIEQILSFVQKAQITAYFSNSTDTKIGHVVTAMRNTPSFEAFNTYMKKEGWLDIKRDDIDDLVYKGHSNYGAFPILQILYPHLKYDAANFHVDHIYPKSKFNQKAPDNFKDRHSYLYNFQLLQGPENNHKRAKDPEVWIQEQFKTNEEQQKYKEDNYIDKDFELTWDNIEKFEEMRSENIKNQLIKKLGIK